LAKAFLTIWSHVSETTNVSILKMCSDFTPIVLQRGRKDNNIDKFR